MKIIFFKCFRNQIQHSFALWRGFHTTMILMWKQKVTRAEFSILYVRVGGVVRTFRVTGNVVVREIGYTLARWACERFTISFRYNVSLNFVRHNRRNGVIRRLALVTILLWRTHRTNTARFWGSSHCFEYFLKVRPAKWDLKTRSVSILIKFRTKAKISEKGSIRSVDNFEVN